MCSKRIDHKKYWLQSPFKSPKTISSLLLFFAIVIFFYDCYYIFLFIIPVNIYSLNLKYHCMSFIIPYFIFFLYYFCNIIFHEQQFFFYFSFRGISFLFLFLIEDFEKKKNFQFWFQLVVIMMMIVVVPVTAVIAYTLFVCSH